MCLELGEMIQRFEEKRAKDKASGTNTTGAREEKTYKCPICKDLEWVSHVEEDGHEVMIPCKCKAERELERAIAFAGISEKFKSKTFGNFEETKANLEIKKSCMHYVSSKAYKQNKSLVIMGQVGSGKTHLAMAIVNNLISKGVRCMYLEYRSFITLVKQSMTDREEYQRQMDKAKRAEVLYLDDFLKGRVTDSDLNVLYEVINARYLADLPVIITTELLPDTINDFDEALGSRIIEMASDYILISKDKNKRLERLER